jgi:hypothetical protein
MLKRFSSVVWEACTVQNIAISVGIVMGLVIRYKLVSWLISNNETILKGAMIRKTPQVSVKKEIHCKVI